MDDLWSDPSVACDLSVLPGVLAYPRLPDHRTLIDRYQMMGLVRDANIHAALYEVERSDHMLPELALLQGSLGTSALLVPWHDDPDLPGSLIPGHFDIIQLLDMLDVGIGDDVLIVGPRGGFICALLDQMGARPVGVEPYDSRIPHIQATVPHLDIKGVEEVTELLSERAWDAILVTYALDDTPLDALAALKKGGKMLLPLQKDPVPSLYHLEYTGEGEVTRTLLTQWNVERGCSTLHGVLGIEGGVEITPGTEELSTALAWMRANADPIRDRIGSSQRLWHIMSIWSADGPRREGEEDVVDQVHLTLSDDLYRMARLLHSIGVLPMAIEHYGTSFQAAPSAEAATLLGLALDQLDESETALAWWRHAIETDDTYADAWMHIGRSYFEADDPRQSIPWLAAATLRDGAIDQSDAWYLLGLAHEKQGRKTAAFLCAQRAIEEAPEREDLRKLLDRCGRELL